MNTEKPTTTSTAPTAGAQAIASAAGGASSVAAAEGAPSLDVPRGGPQEAARGARMRVGTDIVAVKNVADSIAQFGERYLARVFTKSERAYCTEAGRDAASHLAARFAAKEATMKALRPEGDAIDWQSIEVVRMPGGWCEIAVTGAALALARKAGITTFSVSLSHDGEYATAVVVAERAA
jgi:holo-[acyl-carrier protein] synthase